MKLTEAQIRQYHEQGFLFPIRALSPEAAADYRRRLEGFEAEGGAAREGLRHKPHLLFTFLDELVRHPCVLDAVEGVIGPNILCWASSFFTKEPRSDSYISWHQDLTYWGLEPAEIVTAWIALSPSTIRSGAMRVIPGSHTQRGGAPQGHVRRAQPALARPGDPGRGRRGEGGRRGPAAGRDVAAPRQARATARTPTPPTTAGSASRSATCRPTSARWSAPRTARSRCAASTATAISSSRRRRSPTSTRPRSRSTR